MKVSHHINRKRRKPYYHLIQKKAFDKLYSFAIKNSQKLEMEGNFLNLINGIYENGIYEKLTVLYNGEILDAFPKIKN